MKRTVIGILAHVDSGKTTLSEGMLYLSGKIRRLGRVDHGDSFLDTHETERGRGITIFSHQAVFTINGNEYTLLDTPGHVDFSAETERTLRVLDYAVLVISGSDGVQNHTETLWRLLKRYNIPAFVFINKMDISPYEKEKLIDELNERLGGGFVDFGTEHDETFAEAAAVCSDELTEYFLETDSVTDEQLADAVRKREIFPCYFGAALKLTGVSELMKGIDRYTVQKKTGDKFGASVYKIAEDEQGVRLTYMKITSGALKIKDQLEGETKSGEAWSQKVNQIRIYSGAKYVSADEAQAGTVCAVTGLSETYAGEGLGCERDSKRPALEPVLTYRLELPEGTDTHTALKKLKKIEEEDPALHIVWNSRLGEIQAHIMGEVQLEILKRIIADRFGMEVSFGQGGILYKETIAAPVEGVGHYEPLRHYAEVHLLLEPGKRGSGIKIAADCSEDKLDRNWQRLILTHIAEKTHIGVLTGSPITDMKITLVAGRAHQKHTEGGDFRQATYRAIRQGLRMARSVLLEPWYDFSLRLPTENVGRAITDIRRMGGESEPPQTYGDMSVIKGSAPVLGMRDYHTEVTGYTRGLGRLVCSSGGYRECHNAEEVIEAIGYNADNDLENTADSVFCSHGAGYAVKWDHVREHMHVESGLELDSSPSASAPHVTRERVKEYIDGIAGDKELMRIFERTYGKIKRSEHTAVRPRNTAAKPKHKAKPLPQGPEYLLVDGYNIIFAWDELNEIAQESLELARDRLINILCNYRGFKSCELILVFDAYKVKGSVGSVEKHHNISVVYTKEAETADMYIERVTHELGGKRRIRVATSDNTEQVIILGNGATRVSAREFKAEVDEVERAIREYLSE